LKPPVVPLTKMILRDKAGRLGVDGIYLIATQPKPEMYEVRCRTKKETHSLISRIQSAINDCPVPKMPGKCDIRMSLSSRFSCVLFSETNEPDKLPDNNKSAADDLEELNVLFGMLYVMYYLTLYNLASEASPQFVGAPSAKKIYFLFTEQNVTFLLFLKLQNINLILIGIWNPNKTKYIFWTRIYIWTKNIN